MITDYELFQKYARFMRNIRRETADHRMREMGHDMPHPPMREGMCPPPMRHPEFDGPHGEMRAPHGMHEKGPHEGCMPQDHPHGPRMMPNSMSRQRLLVLIDEHPEGIRQKDLAAAEGIRASSVSEVIDRLEDDGYVIRTTDETDRRATLLHLSDLGKARAAEIRDEREAALKGIFAPLTDEEKETLAGLLDKLNQEA